MFESQAAFTALQFAEQLPDMLRHAKSGSLIEYTRATRVEPVTLVDMRSAQLPYIDDVLYAGLNIFSAYYLQAVALSVNVGQVNVLRLLDKLNPNRDPFDAESTAAGTLKWKFKPGGADNGASQESRHMALPFPGQHDASPYSQEDDAPAPPQAQVTGPAGTAVKSVNESPNLAVGKLLEINVSSEGQTGHFPVMVRLMTNTIAPDVMAHTLTLGATQQTSLKERWHGWRSGQLAFFKDLILCQDLIDEHRKNLMEDTSGYYKAMSNNGIKNQIAGILSNNPSVAAASSIFVMNAETAKQVESNLRGKLSDFKTREQLFANNYAMMMFVIDPDWEQVTIFYRSIEQATEVSIRELQRSNKNGKGGPDITDILNAFRQFKSPTL